MTPIAHQGGWDEILIFAVPVAIYALIRLYESRRERREATAAPPDPDLELDEQLPPTSGSPGAGS